MGFSASSNARGSKSLVSPRMNCSPANRRNQRRNQQRLCWMLRVGCICRDSASSGPKNNPHMRSLGSKTWKNMSKQHQKQLWPKLNHPKSWVFYGFLWWHCSFIDPSNQSHWLTFHTHSPLWTASIARRSASRGACSKRPGRRGEAKGSRWRAFSKWCHSITVSTCSLRWRSTKRGWPCNGGKASKKSIITWTNRRIVAKNDAGWWFWSWNLLHSQIVTCFYYISQYLDGK